MFKYLKIDLTLLRFDINKNCVSKKNVINLINYIDTRKLKI